ncbi:hypothetical protein NQ314_013755 [Rhamnusium bicolor]|uniref:SKICH domain-containing protein n=1 Tax=Rhamnusium bicolor TaxID=1586634 RepID=A0AAV8X5I7_9CUCU|nr:hypothetical protein NQ314_013755 [Rhamnusium bicolor]
MEIDRPDSMESNFVSMKPAVEFIDVLDQYSYNENLHCCFKFNDYTPQEGDRISIFKLGWSFVKDYVVFEWAPVGSRERRHTVVFNKHILPKNSNEIYQICYISGENVLQGASSPFQFTAEVLTQNNMSSIAPTEELRDKTSASLGKEYELKKLREENAMLRESLRAVIAQKGVASCKNYDADISELKQVMDNLKASLSVQQNDINMLKLKITEGGEEYKKLYLDKVKIEKKYDKLKTKMEEAAKPVSEMVNFDIGDLKSIPPFPFSK